MARTLVLNIDPTGAESGGQRAQAALRGVAQTSGDLSAAMARLNSSLAANDAAYTSQERTLRAQVSVLRSATQSGQSLAETQERLRVATLRAEGASREQAASIARLEREYRDLSRTQQATQGTGAGLLGTVSRLQAGFAVLAGSLVVRQLVSYAETWTLVQGQLKLVTDSSAELTAVTGRLFAIAQETRTDFEETAGLYARLARVSGELGLSQDTLLTVTKSVNQAILISGVSAESANAALIQLGQGFASGTLRGEELNSVMEQTPRLAQAIAEGMGITIGELRKFGAEGRLTAEAVVAALQAQADTLNEEFGQLPTTIGQATSQAGNSLLRLIGTVNELTGASSFLASTVSFLGSTLDLLTDAATAAGTSLGLIGQHAAVEELDALQRRLEGMQFTLESFQTGIDRFLTSPEQVADLQQDIKTVEDRIRELLEQVGPTNADLGEMGEALDAAGEAAQRAAEKVRMLTTDLRDQVTQQRITVSVLRIAREQGLSLAEAQGRVAGELEFVKTKNAAAAAETARLTTTSLELKQEIDGLTKAWAADRKAMDAATRAAEQARREAERLTLQFTAQMAAIQGEIDLRTLQVQGLLTETQVRERLQQLKDTETFGPERAAVLAQERAVLAAINRELEIRADLEEQVNREFERGRERDAEQANLQRAINRTQQEYRTLTAIILDGIAAGRDYEAVTRDLAIEQEVARLTAEGYTGAIRETAAATVDAGRAFQEAQGSLEAFHTSAVLTTDDFREVATGILRGTQDLPDAFADLGQVVGFRLVEGILFGKSQTEMAILGNFEQLLGPVAQPIFEALGLDLGQGLIGSLVNQIANSGPQIQGGFQSGFGNLGPAFSGATSGPASLGSTTFGSSITGFFNNLGSLGAGAFGTGFGTALTSAFGVNGTIGGLFGGASGGLLGAALLPTLGPLGVFIGSTLGSVIGSVLDDILGGLLGPERIERQKKGIETFVEESLGIRVHASFDRFRASAEVNFAAVEDALESLGVTYALQTDAGIGAVKRFANITQAGFERNRFDIQSAEEAVQELAQSLGVDLVDALNNVGAAMEGALTKNNLSLREYREEVSENASETILLSNLISGAIQVFTAFNPLVDAAAIANKALAGELEEAAIAAGLSAEQYQSFVDDVASGTLRVEDALLRLNEQFGLRLDFTDIVIDSREIERAVEEVLGRIEILGNSAGQVLTQAMASGIHDPELIQDAFIEMVRGALAAQVVADFIDERVTSLLQGIDLTEPIDLSSEAFQELAMKIGLAGEELFGLLEALDLLPDAAEEALKPFTIEVSDLIARAAVDGLQEGFSDPEAVRAFQDLLNRAIFDQLLAAVITEALADIDLSMLLEEGSDTARQLSAVFVEVFRAAQDIATELELFEPALDGATDGAEDFTDVLRGARDTAADIVAQIVSIRQELEDIRAARIELQIGNIDTLQGLGEISSLDAIGQTSALVTAQLDALLNQRSAIATREPLSIDQLNEAIGLTQQLTQLTVDRFEAEREAVERRFEARAGSAALLARIGSRIVENVFNPLIEAVRTTAEENIQQLREAAQAEQQAIREDFAGRREAIQAQFAAAREAAEERLEALRAERDQIREAADARLDALRTELRIAQNFQRVAEQLGNQIQSLATGQGSPLANTEQLAFLQRQAAGLREQIATAGQAELPDLFRELAQVLGQQLSLGVFQTQDPRQRELFNALVAEIEDLQAQAEMEGSAVLSIEQEMLRVEQDQQAQLAAIDAAIQAQRDVVSGLSQQERTLLADLSQQERDALADSAARMEEAIAQAERDRDARVTALEASRDALLQRIEEARARRERELRAEADAEIERLRQDAVAEVQRLHDLELELNARQEALALKQEELLREQLIALVGAEEAQSLIALGLSGRDTLLQGVLQRLTFTLDTLEETLRDVNDALARITPAATGFVGQVAQPTLFLAGERGPETVMITPDTAFRPPLMGHIGIGFESMRAGSGSQGGGGMAVHVESGAIQIHVSGGSGQSPRLIAEEVAAQLDRQLGHKLVESLRPGSRARRQIQELNNGRTL